MTSFEWQLGPPTFFITLTADDMNWLDLLYVLAKRAGMNISMKDVEIMKARAKSSSKPIGEIVDYFWRVEFQLRGSPHVHSL